MFLKNRKSVLLSACVFCVSISQTLRAEYRDFTNLDGKVLSAEILSKQEGAVTLKRKSDNKVFTLKVDLLSQSDRDFIVAWEAPPIPPNPDLYPRTQDEIAQRISEIRSRTGPEWADPWIFKAVSQLNCYRYLCGVPDDVVLDKGLCEKSQKAADVMAKLKKVSHDLGHHTDSCNLCPGASGPRAINAWFAEEGAYNVKRCGHRRWCLSPEMGKTGIAHKSLAKKTYNFSAMWAIDKSRKNGLDFWSYPSVGFYPIAFMKGDSWSAYFDSDIKSGIKNINIRVKKLTERPDSINGDFEALEGVQIPLINKFVYKNSLIFRLNYKDAKVSQKGIYVVDIKGGKLKKRYLTELYSGPKI